jgi:hypothetical protein
MSSRQLLLIRHGLSALDPPPGLLALADIERWRDAYNVTGIAPHSQPPSHLVTAVGGATCSRRATCRERSSPPDDSRRGER